MRYISHPRIRPDTIEERAYQVNMSNLCMRDDTLIILPTSLGKTIIALLTAVEVLETGKKVLMLAPTKPLVEQHYESFSSFLVGTSVGTMNGNMAPEKRAKIIEDNEMIICTPQVVSNDLDKERYGLSKIGLIIYDEAHRAVGDYAYVSIAKHYRFGLTLGMTASPGSDTAKIMEVCENLGITRIDPRTDTDPDVAPYIHDIIVNRIEVNMPEDLLKAIDYLNAIMKPYIDELQYLHLMDPNWPVSTKHMLVIGDTLQKRLARGEKSATVFRGLVAQSACVKLLHAIGLAETQGMSSLRSYIIKLDEESQQSKSSKASREIAGCSEFKKLSELLRTTKVEHPKISKVMSLVSQGINAEGNNRVLVFSQYRDTCDLIEDRLSRIPTVRVAKLIGQSNGGLKQKEQIKMLEDFRNGVYNVVVSTSVGEEGLDIASTDRVIFYEPVPSEIRTIQRRGRTGRNDTGEVFVLVAKNTRDEIFERTSQKKEDQMKELIESINVKLKNRPSSVSKKQMRLAEF